MYIVLCSEIFVCLLGEEINGPEVNVNALGAAQRAVQYIIPGEHDVLFHCVAFYLYIREFSMRVKNTV